MISSFGSAKCFATYTQSIFVPCRVTIECWAAFPSYSGHIYLADEASRLTHRFRAGTFIACNWQDP